MKSAFRRELNEILVTARAQIIAREMQACNFNMSETATRLGIQRSLLYMYVERDSMLTKILREYRQQERKRQ